MLRGGKLHWKSAAWSPTDGQILTGQGTGRSAQQAEVHAARLAIEQSHKEGYKIVRIHSDLWCVCNGIAVWLGKWKHTNWQINGKDIWSKEDWIKMDEFSQSISIYVTHVDAHTGKGDPTSQHNKKADKLAALMITRNIPWQVKESTDYSVTLYRKDNQADLWHVHKEGLKMTLKRGSRSRVIQNKPKWTKTNTFGNCKAEQIKQQKLKICTPTMQELRDLHKALGHCGTHTLFTWGQLKNIDLSWTICKQAVENCTDCPMTIQRFRYRAPPELYKPNCFNAIIQIDLIGPLQTHREIMHAQW
jgi:ribonuclease HI